MILERISFKLLSYFIFVLIINDALKRVPTVLKHYGDINQSLKLHQQGKINLITKVCWWMKPFIPITTRFPFIPNPNHHHECFFILWSISSISRTTLLKIIWLRWFHMHQHIASQNALALLMNNLPA